MKKITALLSVFFLSQFAYTQVIPQTFGNGINYIGKDSSFTMHCGIRFQTLMVGAWEVQNDDLGHIGNFSSNFMLRRCRFKFDGMILTPNLKYKMEFGLTQSDMSGGIDQEHGFAPRYILDAYLDWKFYRNFSLKVGQFKLPGNRERVISSADMQLVDRSLLNSRYNLDRDIGVQLGHTFTLGKNIVFREMAAFTQGEGRNTASNNIGGYDYTFRVEMLPFGNFQSKGDYVGGAIKREEKPKLALGFTYDINENAPRARGQNGGFIHNTDGSYAGKTLTTFFADLMFKYKGLSVMAEYANKQTIDGDAAIYDSGNNSLIVGRYFVGTGLNVQAGWMFNNNIEICGRYTLIAPHKSLLNEEEFTLGLSKYIVGHRLKVQTDLSYCKAGYADNTTSNRGKDDQLFWRLQFDVHF